MNYSLELEGTWEEILSHGSELAGRRVRLLVLEEADPASPKPLTLAERRAFLQLPLETQQHILAEQANRAIEHYEQDTQWQEFLAGDILEPTFRRLTGINSADSNGSSGSPTGG
jgi:hypothetical protein